MLRRVRRRRRVPQFAVLALLLVVNAYLIALLLRSQQEISAEPADQGTVAETASPSRSTAGGSPRSSSTPSAEEESEVAPAERPLIADSAREAWRATVGDCETPGRVERSIDGATHGNLSSKPAWLRSFGSGSTQQGTSIRSAVPFRTARLDMWPTRRTATSSRKPTAPKVCGLPILETAIGSTVPTGREPPHARRRRSSGLLPGIMKHSSSAAMAPSWRAPIQGSRGRKPVNCREQWPSGQAGAAIGSPELTGTVTGFQSDHSRSAKVNCRQGLVTAHRCPMSLLAAWRST